jgi:hypothetical protein
VRDALALRVVTHEIGHVIGLAHSLLNADFSATETGPTTSIYR